MKLTPYTPIHDGAAPTVSQYLHPIVGAASLGLLVYVASQQSDVVAVLQRAR